MKNKLFIILRNKKMVVKINNQEKLAEYPFTTLKNYPNIPFYVNLFELGPIYREIKSTVYKNINSFSKNISKPEIFILLDDDSMGIEKKAIEEFMQVTFSPKKIQVVQQCEVLVPFDTKEFISISKTCRLFVISYLKNRKLIAQKFIDKKELLVDDLKEAIKELHNDCKYKKIEIFLNGIHLKEYSEIGQVIEINELLANAHNRLSNT